MCAKFGAGLAQAQYIAAGFGLTRVRPSIERLTVGAMLTVETVGDQHVNGLADEFIASVTELSFDLGVGQRDFAVAIDHEHAAGTRFHGQRKHLIGGYFPPCRSLRELRGGSTIGDNQIADDFSFAVAQRCDGCASRKAATVHADVVEVE